jgi:hypothetical protein
MGSITEVSEVIAAFIFKEMVFERSMISEILAI